jgi:hypothetical protein
VATALSSWRRDGGTGPCQTCGAGEWRRFSPAHAGRIKELMPMNKLLQRAGEAEGSGLFATKLIIMSNETEL